VIIINKLIKLLKKDGDWEFGYGYLSGCAIVENNSITFPFIKVGLENHGIFTRFLNRLIKEFERIEFSVVLSDKLAEILSNHGFYAVREEDWFNMVYNRWENMFDFIFQQIYEMSFEIEIDYKISYPSKIVKIKSKKKENEVDKE